MHDFRRAMVHALARSRERPRERSEKHAREFGEFWFTFSSEHDADRIRVRLGERDVARLRARDG